MRHALLALALAAAACTRGEPKGDFAAESAKAAALASTVEIFRLTGTEPFWGVAITPTEIRYTTPENMDGVRFPFTPPVVDGEIRRYASSIESPEKHAIEVMIERKECNDGMSDRRYDFTATVSYDGQQLSGCGEREVGPGRS